MAKKKTKECSQQCGSDETLEVLFVVDGKVFCYDCAKIYMELKTSAHTAMTIKVDAEVKLNQFLGVKETNDG